MATTKHRIMVWHSELAESWPENECKVFISYPYIIQEWKVDYADIV